MQHNYCKDIDLTNTKVVLPWVTNCIHRHARRYDFRRLLFRYGLTRSEYNSFLATGDMSILAIPSQRICEDVCKQICERKLKLRPVVIGQRQDKATGKIRWIGNASPLQQIFDFVAVYGTTEIFRKRISPFQMSSIEGRGQKKGIMQIKKWIAADNRAKRYARKHGLRYTSKCKYRVKMDIKQCYPSASVDVFMPLLRKDTKNTDLLWLWETLLKSHRVDVVTSGGEKQRYNGFMIGSWASQWAMQYMLSFLYWHIMSQHNRRGKKIISHSMLYLDDILMLGSNRRQIRSVVLTMIKYAKDKLQLQIKQNWHIDEIAKCGIDMMGCVVWASAKVTMRGRNFIKLRRMSLRFERQNHRLSLRQAKRVASQKGMVEWTDKNFMWQKYKLGHLFRVAQDTVSIYERKCKNADSKVQSRAAGDHLYDIA